MLINNLGNNQSTVLVNDAISIKTATNHEEISVIDVITLAFSTDPSLRWMYPDPNQYLTNFPSFLRAFAGRSFENNCAFYAEDFAGAALWLPPNIKSDEDRLIPILQETVAEQIQDEMFQVFEEMDKYHPQEPHWYLPLIGVETIHQNKGFGSALMKHALALCDKDGLPTYLESSNPKNIPLYERHGFEIMGTIQIGSSPPVTPMLRSPHSL